MLTHKPNQLTSRLHSAIRIAAEGRGRAGQVEEARGNQTSAVYKTRLDPCPPSGKAG